MTETTIQPLIADPKHQANDSLRGYRYQILHSVHAWLSLADDEILYLEGAEDFDIVSPETTTVVQVKDTQRNITLRSQEVNDAINRYWKLRDDHPNRSVTFRFRTRSQIVVEQGDPLRENQAGLHIWNRCSGDEAAVTKISEFLQVEGKISKEVADFLKKAEHQQIYEQLIEPIAWETSSEEASSVEMSIREKLVLHGNRQIIPIPPSHAEKVVDHLLEEALMVATQKDNRELTRRRFLEIFEEQTTQRISTPYLQRLQMLATMVNPFEAMFIEGSSDITIQFQSPIQTDIPPLYPNVFLRTDLLVNVQAKLQSDGIAVLQGGTGRGKTTLAKLTAKAINGSSWLWLNFTGTDPSQIRQHLQQLANKVSTRSSQVHIVLDDLNLQPQQLPQYQEVLGVVVYRVLERGAKLLITSQHELPNNLIRLLGISPSVALPVPNFTISEIEQFAQQLGCPVDDAETWAKVTQAQTRGHPMLVRVRLVQLQQEDWKRDIIESIFQTPQELVTEREQARQLLLNLPDDQREFLYRLSLVSTEFRKDYALNIGEIPEPIPHPGDIFDQLVGPWIDQADGTYYTISPLLADAAGQVWPEDKIKGLHAQITNAILKARNLTTIEARAIFLHSMFGRNRIGFIAVIQALTTVPENNWERLSQEFSWLIHVKTDIPERLFPRDFFVNYLFRSLQYRIAVEVEPETAPKILEIWDKETKLYKSHESYLQVRITLATQALIYQPVLLPVKQMVDYLKELIDIKDSAEDVQGIYDNLTRQLEKYKTDKSNFFSILFSFILMRQPMYPPFLSDLIDALDELEPKMRTLILADFEEDSVDSRILIDSVWLAEENLENPDWTRCLQVFDKVIEKTLAWGYPHIAAASARGRAIIYDEYLHAPDTAHKVLQDALSRLGPLPVIEEERALVYLYQEYYKEALDIYERILPNWHPSSGKLDMGPSEGYRRAAICAAHLDDWEKAATFFEDGAKRVQSIENIERYIGLYADAGFAHFKAGNMLESIKLLNLVLQKFEMLPQDDTDVKYFTLKRRLACALGWMAWHEREDYSSELEEPSAGFCSNPETNEKVLTLPDSPTGYSWLHLAQIEYNCGHETIVLEHALQIVDQEAYPALSFLLAILETQYDFRNKTLDNLPRRIHQLANACASVKRHNQTGKGIGKNEISSIPIDDLPNFADVREIVGILVAALLVQLPVGVNMREILAIWRTNSSELPIKDNIIIALNLIESMLFGDKNGALTVMRAAEVTDGRRLVAALKIVLDIETSPDDLFYAHTLIATSLIDQTWLDSVTTGLAERLSAQWLEKIKSGVLSQMNKITVRQIEQACNNSETGKKKIGQILLAAYPAVSLMVPSEALQQFRSWSE